MCIGRFTCVPSNSYVCLVISPKQHCQILTTETANINSKGLGREILRSQREGNFKGVSWKLGLINHHGLKKDFRNWMMPFYMTKKKQSPCANARKKNQWKTSQTFVFKEKAWSTGVKWWKQKCRAVVLSGPVFGTPFVGIILEMVIYISLDHVMYVIHILVMLGIKGQQFNNLISTF